MAEDNLGRLERSLVGVERQQSLLAQQVQMMADQIVRHDQKLYGVDGTPGLLVAVDRLERLNTNERFKELGRRTEALERAYWKFMGASMAGGAMAGLVLKLIWP